MALIIQKFGGTSVADINRICETAKLVVAEKEKGNDVIVVVSAMSGVTSQLVSYTNQVSKLLEESELAEYDAIISSGEQVTAGLLALKLQDLGYKSRSFLSWQAEIQTDHIHAKSRIENINKDVLLKHVKEGFIPVIAGFQGVNKYNRISTMGRGGSDTSAVAVAAALNAQRCDIYTDVTGIFTADPRIVPKARKLEKLGYEEVIEMASLGAKMLQIRSVEMAIKHQVKLQVLSSFTPESGSLLVKDEEIMERRLITAIAHDTSEARVTLVDVDNIPGVGAEIFKPLADQAINIDMIIQNIHIDETKATVTFTLNEEDLDRALKAIKETAAQKNISYKEIIANKDVAKVSIVGVGMKQNSGIAQRVFQVLANKKINIMAITTSEIKISILIPKEYTELAVRILHDEFALDKQTQNI
jgi:aspartate kinase